MEITLRVSGMDCAACAPRLQRRLVAVAGVERVMVNYAASRCKIEYDGEHADYAALYAAVRRTGFDVPPETAEIECAAFDREAAKAALEALDGVRRVEDTGDGKLRAVLWTGVESRTLLAALRARGIYAAVTGRTGGDEEIQLHSRMALLRALCISVLFTMLLVWDLHPYVQLALASVVQFGPGGAALTATHSSSFWRSQISSGPTRRWQTMNTLTRTAPLTAFRRGSRC